MIKTTNEVNFDRFDDDYFDEEWAKHIPKEYIKGATLLSKEEYEKCKDNIPYIEEYWWLKSDGYYTNSVYYVYDDGGVYIPMPCCCGCGYGIRPALVLNLQSSNLDSGNNFEFGEHTFTIISNDLAICDDFIARGCFKKDKEAPDTNIYEKSDAKKIVDDWFSKSYNEYGG